MDAELREMNSKVLVPDALLHYRGRLRRTAALSEDAQQSSLVLRAIEVHGHASVRLSSSRTSLSPGRLGPLYLVPGKGGGVEIALGPLPTSSSSGPMTSSPSCTSSPDPPTGFSGHHVCIYCGGKLRRIARGRLRCKDCHRRQGP